MEIGYSKQYRTFDFGVLFLNQSCLLTRYLLLDYEVGMV